MFDFVIFLVLIIQSHINIIFEDRRSFYSSFHSCLLWITLIFPSNTLRRKTWQFTRTSPSYNFSFFGRLVLNVIKGQCFSWMWSTRKLFDAKEIGKSWLPFHDSTCDASWTVPWQPFSIRAFDRRRYTQNTSLSTRQARNIDYQRLQEVFCIFQWQGLSDGGTRQSLSHRGTVESGSKFRIGNP